MILNQARPIKMNGLSVFLIALVLLWGIAFYRIPLLVWTTLAVGLLSLSHWLGWIGATAWFLWAMVAFVVIPLNIPFIRRHFTKIIFNWFRGVLPPMSNTEKEAIEAGDVWWEKELFQGRPQWKHLLNMPKPVLSEQEQLFLDEQVETLCEMLDDWQIVHENSDLPNEAWDYLKKEKFFGMIIPKKYGGLEFSPQAHSSVILKIATRSISAAVTAMVPNSLGPAELLLHYGTDSQKNTYLPRLADGSEIPCFALTGPEAGSDAGSIPDKGILCKGIHENKEVLGISITFDKRYITLAPVATVMGLAFKLFDPDKLLGDKVELGITLCLIPTNHSGVEIGNRHFPLNLAFMNGPIRGKNVFVPLEWIIGGPKNIGQGWRMLMECLSAGRGISLPALSTATGVLAYRMSGAYSAIRRQFNLPIGAFEGVEESLARIAGNTYLLQATRLFTATAIAQGIKPAVATAIAKYHMTEMSRKVINDAMDVHGGRGIMMGPQNYIGRGYQSIPVSITVEGANILTRSLMIFGQGAIRCHPYAFHEMSAAASYTSDPKLALKIFDKNCIKHIGYFLSNLVRCFTFSLSRGVLTHTGIHDITQPYLKKLNWLSAALAVSADVALFSLGGELKRREKLSARLGDVLSQLYISSSVLKYYHDEGRPNSDWPMVEWALQTCLYNAQEAFFGLFQNFPLVGIGRMLKWLIFPFGKAFSLPADKLGQKMVQSMLTLSQTREKLTEYCFLGKTTNDPTGLIEIGFIQLIKAQPALSKMSRALKEQEINKNLSFDQQLQAALNNNIINENEVELLRQFEETRKKVIAVDEFIPDYALGCQIPCIKTEPNVQVG